MNKLLNISLFSALLFSILACKKEVVEIPEPNQPVFSIEGTIDGDSISWTAGIDGTMETEINNVNGVSFFNGKLLVGDQELQIGFFDGDIDHKQARLAKILNLKSLNFATKSSEPLFNIAKGTFEDIEDLPTTRWYIDGAFYAENKLEIFTPGS